MTHFVNRISHYLQKKNFVPVSAILTFLTLSCLNVNVAIAENEIYSGTKVKTFPGTYGISVKDFVIKGGANFSNNGILVLKGDLVNGNLLQDLIGSVSFKGSTVQSISGLNIIQNLVVDNASGIMNLGNTRVNGTLFLSNGLITLGNYNLILGPSATISGELSPVNMIIATDAGELRKIFPGGYTGSFLFPVGDNTGTTEYSPVTLTFSAGTFVSENYAGLNLRNSKHPDPSISGNYINRYWNISQNGISDFNCDAIFNYVPADVVGNENLILCKRITPTPVITYGSANTITHQLTANAIIAFGTYTGGSQSIPTLTGPTVACKDVPGNIYTTDAGKTNYIWTVSSGGTITDGGTSTSNTVTVKWNTAGSQTVSVQYNEASGTAVLNVTVLGPTLSGRTDVCKLSTHVYTTEPGMTDYNWVVNGGLKVGGGGTSNNTCTIYWTAVGSRYVKVKYTNGSCTSITTLPVTVNTSSPSISGPSAGCLNSSYTYSTDPGMTNYLWTTSPGNVIEGPYNTNKVKVKWTITGTQYLYCIYTSPYGCPITTTTFKVAVFNIPNPTISGPTVVLQGSTALYTTETGMNSYIWTVSSGGGILSGGSGYSFVEVIWEGAGPQTVSVNYSNIARCAALTPTVLNVMVNPGGPSAPLSNQNSNNGIDIINGLSESLNKNGIPLFSVYPVPNDGKFTISIDSDKKDIYTINIYNTIGADVYHLKDLIIQGTYKQQVDISSISDGVYMILIKNSEGQKSRRIIIKK
jgi:hypothetical protein